MKAARIQAVALDMDGLLLNTEDLYEEVTLELLRRRGKGSRNDLRKRMIGLPAPKAYEVLIEGEGLKETWEELHLETMELFEKKLEKELKSMPGVKELLDVIENEGLPKCVATSSTRSFASKALEMVGILDRFDFILTAEEVGRGKPFPDIYIEAAQRMRTNTPNMLVLEDSENGTKAGVKAGAYVISVPNRHTKDGNFEGAREVVSSLLDERIKNLLKVGYHGRMDASTAWQK